MRERVRKREREREKKKNLDVQQCNSFREEFVQGPKVQSIITLTNHNMFNYYLYIIHSAHCTTHGIY